MSDNKGKAYANKKKKEDRPIGDFYSTPQSLILVAADIIKKEFKIKKEILDPCCGKQAISRAMYTFGDYRFCLNDLYQEIVFCKDYLKTDFFNDIKYAITNPPFSLWDEFVLKAKTHCKKFMFIGRLNYFGTHGRYKNGLWKNLKAVYPFNRYVDYQTPYREDGHFHVGAMATAWFLWDMDYTGLPTMEILDVQKYATLGAFKK